MPTYPYECKACGGSFEAVQRMTDKPHSKCPMCGKNALNRVICIPTLLLPRKNRPENALRPSSGTGRFSIHLPPGNMPGVYSVSSAPNGDIIVHPNLAGPPPGCAPEQGRVVVGKNEKKDSNKPKD